MSKLFHTVDPFLKIMLTNYRPNVDQTLTKSNVFNLYLRYRQKTYNCEGKLNSFKILKSIDELKVWC